MEQKPHEHVPVNPRVANTIRELLFLTPEDRGRKIWLVIGVSFVPRKKTNLLSSETYLAVGGTVKGFPDDILR